MSTPPKRRKSKKARPKLQPISSPDFSRSGSNDEFGFTDVVLTKGRDDAAAATGEAAGADVSSSMAEFGSEMTPGLKVASKLLTDASCEGRKVARRSSLKAAASDDVVQHQSEKNLTEPNLMAETIQSESDVALAYTSEAIALDNKVVLERKKTHAASSSGRVSEPKDKDAETSLKISPTESEMPAPTTKQFVTAQPETSTTIVSCSPIESGVNYASHYFSSPTKTPETAKTHNTTETDSMTQNDEEDAEMLESIQQPVFDLGSEVKSTPTKTESMEVCVATATPVLSNVTASNTARLKVDTHNPEEMISHIKRPKRKSSKRLQPRSTLFSPEGNANPKTPDADGYDVFGFDLHKSSAKGPPDEKGKASTGEPGQNIRPVNLEQTYKASVAIADNRTEVLQTPSNEVDDTQEETPQTPSVEGGAKSCSRQSSVSFNELVQDSITSIESENTATVHLLGSKSDPHHEEPLRGSCSESDEASFSSSDGEMSYFSESRAADVRPRSFVRSPPKMHPSYPPNLLMRTRLHPQSTSFGVRNPIEMKLSLSVSEDEPEEPRGILPDMVENEELILYTTYSPTKGDSFGSSIVESASSESDGESYEHSKPLASKRKHGRHASSTPLSNTSGSTDDAGVVSELSAYLISSRIEAANETETSGRESPVGGGHIKSALKRKSSNNSETPTPTNADGARYIYDDVQSAVTAAKSKAGAHRPASSWDTSSLSGALQSNPKVAPKPTQVHSPGGAFNTTSAKRSPYTPEDRVQPSTGLHSLAYSEDKEESNEKTPFASLRHPVHDVKYEVYSSRWGVLFCVSVLNLLAGWICFSVAPIASSTEAFADLPEYLVSIFLFSSCIGCAMEPIALGRLGLRKTVVFGALLLMLGSLINSNGVPLLYFDDQDDKWRLYSGFFVVGFSQPFYQCTVSIITNAWFPGSERRLASGIVLNCSQLGIMLSFVFGTLLVNSDDDVDCYFQLICLISVLTFCMVAFMVDDAPPLPPPKLFLTKNEKRRRSKKQRRRKSSTLREKNTSSIHTESNVKNSLPECDNSPDIETGETSEVKQEQQSCLETIPLTQMSSPIMTSSYGSTEHNSTIASSNSSRQEYECVEPTISQTPYNLAIDIRCDQIWLSTKACFSFNGFTHCIVAYISAGIVLNTLSTFMSDLVQPNGAANIWIGVVGSGFQLLTLISTLIFNIHANKSRKVYRIILSLLVLGAFALLMCSLWLGFGLGLDACILVVAFLVGPLQSLSTCLGSKVARSLSESTVLNIQRLYSNLFSAATILLFSVLRQYSVTKRLESHNFDWSFDLLIMITAFSAIYFAFFVRSSALSEEKSGAFNRTGVQTRNMLILPNRRFPQQPYQPWVPPGRRKAKADYPFLVPSS